MSPLRSKFASWRDKLGVSCPQLEKVFRSRMLHEISGYRNTAMDFIKGPYFLDDTDLVGMSYPCYLILAKREQKSQRSSKWGMLSTKIGMFLEFLNHSRHDLGDKSCLRRFKLHIINQFILNWLLTAKTRDIKEQSEFERPFAGCGQETMFFGLMGAVRRLLKKSRFLEIAKTQF